MPNSKLSSKLLNKTIDYQGVYPCPLCRAGDISNMALMEAMSCNFCQQIFTIDLEKQELILPSRQPPLTWRWDGMNWKQPRLEGVELGWGYTVGALAFIALPTTLTGIIAYYLPPQPQQPFTWVPCIWAFLTFLSHSSVIIWLFVEIYQIPVASYFRAMQQRLLNPN